MMLSATNNLSLQFLSPAWNSRINIVGQHKSAYVRNDRTSNKAKVPFLPSYWNRLKTSFAVLASDPKRDSHLLEHSKNVNQSFFFTSSQQRILRLPLSITPIRSFKTKSSQQEASEENKKPGKNESNEEISGLLKVLVKNSEKTQDQNQFNLAKGLTWSTIVAAVLIGSIVYAAYKNLMKANFGKSIEDTGVTTNVTFDDIRGADEVKAELVDVVEYLKDPKKFTDMGAKLPKGILLVGPPGTGKTLLAKAVAGEAGVSFFYASGSEFDEMLVGMGALRVRQLFDKARKKAPAIIFLDEIDACGGKRANTTIQPYARQTINQLLQEMDGFTENDTVVVLAATNDAKVLDKALVRPGRFDTQVQVLLPDIHGRKEILKLYLDKLSSVSIETVDLDKLASLTIEMTGADLSNLVNQAALRSIKLKKSKVDQEDLEFALDKVRMGPELKTRVRTENELRATAYHEAGHALIAYYTPAAMNIYKATIVQRGPALGHVSLVPSKDDEVSKSKIKLLASIDVCMGGRVAEELMFGKDNVSTGASSDISMATQTAYSIVCNYGMSDKLGPMTYVLENLSEITKQTVENEVKLILHNSYEKAKKILTEKPAEHRLLAEGLLKYESLSYDEIKLLLQSKNMNSIKVKRQKEEEEKILKKLKEASSSNIDVGLQAPVIDYIPKRSDADL